MKKFIHKIKILLANRIIIPRAYKKSIFIENALDNNSFTLLGVTKKGEEAADYRKFIKIKTIPENTRVLTSPHYQFGDKKIFLIKNARLIGRNALILDKKGRIIKNAISFNGKGRFGEFLKNLILKNSLTYSFFLSPFNFLRHFKPEKSLDSACSLVPLWLNYFHWIAEEIPKIKAVEYYKEKYQSRIKLIIPQNPPAYLTKTLNYLGYTSGDWIEWTYNKALVRNLIVPTFPELSKETLRWLNNRITDQVIHNKTANKKNYRIFISREDADNRRIINENEVTQAIGKYGFKAYKLGKLSFEEQVDLFYHAEAVIATHGAGLVNLVWGQHIKVIEIFGSFIQLPYARICKNLNFPYEQLLAHAENQTKNANIYIPVNELIGKIEELNLTPKQSIE